MKEQFVSQWSQNYYEMLNLWVHSAPHFHQFNDANLSAPDLGALPKGPQFCSVWGCHAFDFLEQPASNSFATWYIMGTNNVLGAVGVSRSIGTPEQEYLIGNIHAVPSVADLLINYLDLVTSPSYIGSSYPNELHTFIYDITFVGDPYILGTNSKRVTKINATHRGWVLRSAVEPSG